MQAAMNLGVDTLKFFPAETNGGVAALSALAAGTELRNVSFILRNVSFRLRNVSFVRRA
jgi:2-keto-3-deoxy-6-phosphogluconate aldolase